MHAQPILIFEGILALYEKRFRDLMDLKIFVMTDDDIRLSRRIQRDLAERGRSIESVLMQYNRFVKTSYDEFIKPSMKYADIIIPHGRSNTVAIDFVLQNLKTRISVEDISPTLKDQEKSCVVLSQAEVTKVSAVRKFSSNLAVKMP